MVFNFRYMPWKDVLDWFAQEADLSLVMESPPPGTFNYTDGRIFTPAEGIDLLNGVLLTKGYTLVRRERMLMLINLDDGIPPELVSQVKPEELDSRGEYELVSCLFQLERMTPEEAEEEIRKLVGRQGDVVVLPRARQVLVTETAGKLRTIRRMLQAVEKPDEGGNISIAQLPLEHITPEEAMVIIRQIMNIGEDSFSTEDGSLRLSMDLAGSRLLVKASPDALAELKDVVKLIDVPVETTGTGPGIVASPQIEVYSISNADPQSVLSVMQTLLAGLPDARLALDPKTNNLIALARPDQHRTIQATLAQMQQEFNQVEVIQLSRLDPATAKLAVESLFGIKEDDDSQTGPRVSINEVTRQLLVRGTRNEIERIRATLTKMGETFEGPAIPLAGTPGANIRMIPMTGSAARDVMEQIEMIWPSVRPGSRIRVVTPSAVAPTLRSSDDVPGAERRSFQFGPTGPRAVFPADSDEQDARTGGDRREPRGRRPEASRATPTPDISQRGASPETASFVAEAYRPSINDEHMWLTQLTSSADDDKFGAGASDDLESKTNDTADDSADYSTAAIADIVVSVGPNGLMIASEDLTTLDAFEQLVRALSDPALNQSSDYTIFYLKYAKAEIAASLLRTLIGSSSSSTTTSTSSTTASPTTSLGFSGLFGSLAELSSVTPTGPIQITPDVRLNAIVIRAAPIDVELATQLLKVIDQESSPENVQVTPPPRLIPVFNADVADVEQVVKDVFKYRLEAPNTGGGGGGNDRGDRGGRPDFRQFMFGRNSGGDNNGGNNGNNGGGTPQQPKEPDMTIGTDPKSNSLVVSAPDPLFKQVEALVKQLDEVATESSEITRVVTVSGANPDTIQQALSSMFGGDVTSNTSSSSNSNDSRRRSNSSDQDRDAIRRRMDFFNAMQRGGGGFPFRPPGGDQGGDRGGRNSGRDSGRRGGNGR
ncbi:MAG: hypothetical protein KDA60_06090 [Planctomycetales bacterium]|nr:hypothetical protein [Planctomycetales bacterium]